MLSLGRPGVARRLRTDAGSDSERRRLRPAGRGWSSPRGLLADGRGRSGHRRPLPGPRPHDPPGEVDLRGVRGKRDAVPRGADPVSLPYTTEGFIRRAVGGVLDGTYRGRGVCSACLAGMTLERLHRGWRRSEVELAMDKVFKTPAPLGDMPAGPR